MKNNKTGHTLWQIVLWMYAYVKPYRAWFHMNNVCLLLKVGITIATAYYVQNIVQDVIDRKDFSIITNNVVFVFLVILLGVVVNYLSVYANGRFGEYAVRDLKKDLTAHIRDMVVRDLDNSHSGDLVSRVNNDTGRIHGFIIDYLPNMLYLPILGVSVSVYLLIMDWRLYLACFIILPASMVVVKIFKDKTARYARNWNDYFGKSSSIAQDIIGGIGIVKAFNIQGHTLKKYRGFMDKALDNGIREDRMWLVVNIVTDIMFQAPMAICMLLGGYMALTGHLQLGVLFGFIQLIYYVIEPAASVSELLLGVADAQGSVDRIMEIKNKAAERKDGEAFPLADSESILDLRNVSFSYSEGNEILKNVSFQVKKGNTIAVVGASGSGKSTLLNLICGFYEAQGDMRLYGKRYEAWSLEGLRGQIALVSQNVYLFPGTIRENLTYGKESAGDDEIVEAAKAADAHNFILGLDNGYETRVGERGALLSGGQRQRISIARAILKNAPVLLLDEPTSALDAESEKLIQNALKSLMNNRTVIVVAHKLSTVIGADEILVLQDGTITERGNHQELLQRAGLYFHLYKGQFAENPSQSEEATG